jgi:hypothetical protein
MTCHYSPGRNVPPAKGASRIVATHGRQAPTTRFYRVNLSTLFQTGRLADPPDAGQKGRRPPMSSRPRIRLGVGGFDAAIKNLAQTSAARMGIGWRGLAHELAVDLPF